MKEQIEITLDNISIIGSKTLNPKQLICSLCYCIHFDMKQCKNPKCLMLFCDNCYSKSKMLNSICPFCRMSIDYRKPDSELALIIDGLLFYCNKTIECKAHYAYLDYTTYHSNHINLKAQAINCTVCLKSLNNSPNAAKCIICLQKGCSLNIDSIPFNLCTLNKLIESCMKRCFICRESVCIKCLGRSSKKFGQNFICGFCSANCFFCYEKTDVVYVCDFCKRLLCGKCKADCETCSYVFCKDRKCYQEKMESCDSCSKISTNYYVCLHTFLFQCKDCYPSCSMCQTRRGIVECNFCSKLLCGINCGVKCKECKLINCPSCMSMCSICKKILCSSCSKHCSNCPKSSSLVTCRECNSDTIRKCQNGLCAKNLCINCWNVCNYCNTVFCSDHSVTCINCEESMCAQHYHKCNYCSEKDDDVYKRLCLKRCTFQCSFCPNVSNVYCNPANHTNTLVNNYNCEHNVCLSCIKRCTQCTKIVVHCPKCIVNYYFIHCRYCERYLCITCSKNCSQCEDNYCSLAHQCYCCKKLFDSTASSCLKCVFAQRIECQQCRQALPQCEICSKRYICSRECYKLYLKQQKSTDHLCQSYECSLHNSMKKNNSVCLFEEENNGNRSNCNFLFSNGYYSQFIVNAKLNK